MSYRRCLFLVVTTISVAAVGRVVADDSATIVDLSGVEHTGPLQQLTATRLAIGTEETKLFDTSALLSVRFGGHKSQARHGGAVVILVNGDRLFIQSQTMDDENITAAWQRFPAWPEVKIPLERVQAVVFDLPKNAEVRNRLVTMLLGYRENSDAVILKNGDRLDGELLMISPDSLLFAGPVGKLSIVRSDVRAVGFNNELLSFPEVTGKRVLLELTDGTRLTAGRVALDERGLLAVDALFGAELRIPLSAIRSMRFLGGRAEYLSDLEAAEFRFTPFLKTRWPLGRDRNVLGGPLRLRGREYSKGLGMHSRSEVSYDIKGKYREFRATVGVDDTARGQGSVVFAIEVDGKRVYSSQPITGKSDPLSIPPVDVAGKKRLTLIVDFGHLGDIRDHADWCNAVLIR